MYESLGFSGHEIHWNVYTARERVTLRDEHNAERTLVSIDISEQHVDIVNGLAAKDTPFYARDLPAQFPQITFDQIKQLLENCARRGLLTLLCSPSIYNNKN